MIIHTEFCTVSWGHVGKASHGDRDCRDRSQQGEREETTGRGEDILHQPYFTPSTMTGPPLKSLQRIDLTDVIGTYSSICEGGSCFLIHKWPVCFTACQDCSQSVIWFHRGYWDMCPLWGQFWIGFHLPHLPHQRDAHSTSPQVC